MLTLNEKTTREILLVDDDPVLGKYLERVLEASGFRVRSCRRPDEALHLVHESFPDAVVTDLEMPGIDGLELCVLLKSRDALRRIPVIMISGCAGADGPQLAAFSGADAYFEKPLPQAEFLRTLRALLQSARIPPRRP